jgi:hypothetical protein
VFKNKSTQGPAERWGLFVDSTQRTSMGPLAGSQPTSAVSRPMRPPVNALNGRARTTSGPVVRLLAVDDRRAIATGLGLAFAAGGSVRLDLSVESLSQLDKLNLHSFDAILIRNRLPTVHGGTEGVVRVRQAAPGVDPVPWTP